MDIKQEQIDQAIVTSKSLMVGGAGTTVGSRLWTWLGENHDAIASICSITGLAVCIAGFILNLYITNKRK